MSSYPPYDLDDPNLTKAEFYLHVGRRIRRRRRLIGMTQMQLAERVGTRFQQVQKYECGANRVSPFRLVLIAQALEVSPEYFLSNSAKHGSVPVVSVDEKTFVGNVGKDLRRARVAFNTTSGRKTTQQDVAEMIGVRFQQVQKYESGANTLPLINYYYSFRKLGASLEEIGQMMVDQAANKPGFQDHFDAYRPETCPACCQPLSDGQRHQHLKRT